MPEDVAIRLREARAHKQQLQELIDGTRRRVQSLQQEHQSCIDQEKKLTEEFYALHDSNCTQMRYGLHNPTWNVIPVTSLNPPTSNPTPPPLALLLSPTAITTSSSTTDVSAESLENRVLVCNCLYQIVSAEVSQSTDDVAAAEVAYRRFVTESQQLIELSEKETEEDCQGIQRCQEEWVMKQHQLQRCKIIAEELRSKVVDIRQGFDKKVLNHVRELFADKPFAPPAPRTVL
eukprot:PhF_6_TR38340/c0_g1_i1/m.57162